MPQPIKNRNQYDRKQAGAERFEKWPFDEIPSKLEGNREPTDEKNRVSRYKASAEQKNSIDPLAVHLKYRIQKY